MDDREMLRNYFKTFQGLSSPTANVFIGENMENIAKLCECSWAFHLLTELRTSKTVDEVLSGLDDTQVLKVKQEIIHLYEPLSRIFITLWQNAEVATAQLSSHRQFPPHDELLDE